MVSWIRLETNLFDNPKIQMLSNLPKGDSYVSFWVRLLCMAGKLNNGGYVYVAENAAYTPQLLAAITGKPVALVKTMLKTMQELHMIDIDSNGIIYIIGWNEHQNTSGLEKIREQTRERTRLYRERKKQSVTSNSGDASQCVTSDATSDSGDDKVTQQNKNKKENKNRENNNSLSFSLSCHGVTQNVTQLYEQKIGMINANVAEQLADLLEQYGEERVVNGIQIAHDRRARNIGYVAKCVENPIPENKTEYVDPFKAVFGDGGISNGSN